MNERNNPNLKSNSQTLRKNMTKEEKHLWYDFLKNIPYTVNRQKVIGDYIVDFYCASANIVIEIDGIQHKQKENKEKDVERDLFFERIGIKVLRYPNINVNMSFNAICEDILKNIEERIQKM